MRIVLLSSSLIMFLLAPTALGQVGEPPLEEMSKLNFLVGTWEGTGRMRMGPNPPEEVRVVEKVQPKAGGAVLLIEGIGRVGTPGGADERVVHNALGIISFDSDSSAYRMRAYRGDGRFVDPKITVEPNKIVWIFDGPPQAGTVRYTITLNDRGQWHEIGESSRDGGKTWNPFFEMTLDRKSSE